MTMTPHRSTVGLAAAIVCTLTWGTPGTTAAQQRGVISVTEKKVLGTGGECTATATPTQVTAGPPFDTIVVRVVADTGKDVIRRSPLTIVLWRNGIPLDSLPNATESILQSVATSPTATVTYTLRASGARDLCRLALAATSPPVADTTQAARLATADSLERAAKHKRAAETGNSFVILSLIKSISGQIPEDEFFDLRMKFGGDFGDYDAAAADSAHRAALELSAVADRLEEAFAETRTAADSVKATNARRRANMASAHAERAAQASFWTPSRIFSFASIDVALSTRVDTGQIDTVTNQRLTDAQLSMNYIVTGPPRTKIPDRIGYAGALFKVFDTRSFLGIQYGGLELSGSRLEGTSVNVAYLRRLYPDSVQVQPGKPADPQTNTPATAPVYAVIHNRNYAYTEFYIRVPGAQFLDRLRVRGGLLLPIGKGTRERVTYRVTLSVPILDLTRF